MCKQNLKSVSTESKMTRPTSVVASMDAPYLSSSSTTAMRFFLHATCSGVNPFYTASPRHTYQLTTSSPQRTSTKSTWRFVQRFIHDTHLQGGQVWHVLMKDHTYSCHSHFNWQVEWAIRTFTFQPQSISALTLVCRAAEGVWVCISGYTRHHPSQC